MPGAPRLDRLERVTDLVLVLLNATQPLTLDAIALQVPGYPAEHAARRQAFERDKRLLRDEGIPVETRRLPGNEQYGYLIEREDFYLPDLALEPDEQVALHLAVAGVHLADPSGRDALLKLGATGLGEVRPVATLDTPRSLILLFEAVRTQAVASFTYRQEPRRVAPAALWFRFGHWYLVAWDLERAAVRTFRADRIDGDVTVGEPGSAPVPDGLDVKASLPDEPWRAEGEDLVVTRIRVDAVEGPRVSEEVGADRVERREPDGSAVVRLQVGSFVALRAWVVGLMDHAEVLEPPAFRAELVTWLSELADGAGGPSGPLSAAPVAPAESTPGPPGGDQPDDQSPAVGEINRRLRRLLAVVGWLAQVGEAPIDEVARRFGMGEGELVRELELAACCGVPPYTPDALLEIEVSETTVRAFLPAEFARPRRLTPAEGFAVAASARVLLAVPGSDDGALGRALAKLEAALGAREAIGVDVQVPPFLVEVRQASEAGRPLEIEYHSASRDELTSREVEPIQVITADGQWYLDAYCRRAGDLRRFRVDRITAVRTLDEAPVAERRGARPAEGFFVPGPGAVEVELALGPGAQWVPESVPVREVRRAVDGTVASVVLDVAGMAWFERLLLQLGDQARVLRPQELADLTARAAQKVLEVYQKD